MTRDAMVAAGIFPSTRVWIGNDWVQISFDIRWCKASAMEIAYAIESWLKLEYQAEAIRVRVEQDKAIAKFR